MRYLLFVFLISLGLFAQDKSADAKSAQPPQPSSTPAQTGPGKDAPAQTSPASRASGWQVQEHKGVNGTREVALVLDSENAVGGGAGLPQAHLAIRCSKRKPEVFVNIGGRFESVPGKPEVVDVRIKFDRASWARQQWLAAADHEAAFALRPDTLIKRMAASKTFQFSCTPVQKGETTATFKIGDLKEKLAPVADVCGL